MWFETASFEWKNGRVIPHLVRFWGVTIDIIESMVLDCVKFYCNNVVRGVAIVGFVGEANLITRQSSERQSSGKFSTRS